MIVGKNIGGDKVIWIIVIALAIFSFLPVYSASSNFGANLIFFKYHKTYINNIYRYDDYVFNTFAGV